MRASRGHAVVLFATFLLDVFRDLTEGILVGFGIGALLFLHRMAQAVQVEHPQPMIEPDKPDQENGGQRTRYDSTVATDPNVVVYRISGAFFFGAAASVAAALERIGEHPKAYVIDFTGVSPCRNRRYRYLSSTSIVLSQPMRWKLSRSQRSAVS